MLSLQLKSGEYLTIGDEIAVQVFKQSGPTFRVEIKAPRELPILRGAVRERGGGGRPDGLYGFRPTTPSQRQHSARSAAEAARRRELRSALWEKRNAALDEMSAILDRMDGPDAAALRACLDRVRELSAEEIVV